ncbi:MAG: ligase-associated DNA damage response endonuclease PdeM [bacterium]|nr:ligase-associated DNA damage response endonuclease PdeM [bacterium]
MTIKKEFEYTISDQSFLLLAQKALFWKNEQMLMISDVHLGKAGHFRKHGIALPKSSNDENLSRIDLLIEEYQPNSLLFLGDLFHSEKNDEWDAFKLWRKSHRDIEFILVLGNHEIYPQSHYELLGIKCYDLYLKSGIKLLHDNSDLSTIGDNLFCISGHIHPAIQMKGKGRQRLRLPCFHIHSQSLLMPAFGNLTGSFTIKPSSDDQVFAIIDDQIIEINT